HGVPRLSRRDGDAAGAARRPDRWSQDLSLPRRARLRGLVLVSRGALPVLRRGGGELRGCACGAALDYRGAGGGVPRRASAAALAPRRDAGVDGGARVGPHAVGMARLARWTAALGVAL